MSGLDIKETMEQIHISEEMQEEIIRNVQKRMEGKLDKDKTRNWKKMAAVAAALVLVAGLANIPVQAIVQNVVKIRMERMPKERVQEIQEVVQNKESEADIFSREFSDKEEKRYTELWRSYKRGVFPEREILQVDNVSEVTEGILCYINDTGEFHLPECELTDEEFLEIIDFQHMMSYSIEQSPAAQEEREKSQEEQERLKERVRELGGISGQEALEIATNQMKSELGAAADGKLPHRVILVDGSQLMPYVKNCELKGDLAYDIVFKDPIATGSSWYFCTVDAVDGSVVGTD